MLNKYSEQESPEIDVASFRRYVFRRLDGIPKDSDGRAGDELEKLERRLRGLLGILDQIESKWDSPSIRQDRDLGN
jgi:hypothetical protein